MDKQYLKLAQAQTPAITDPAGCIRYLDHAARFASDQGCDLLALPEMFCCPYDISCFAEYAEPEGGPMWQACSDIARKYNLYFSAGTMPEIDAQGRIYNTAYVFGRDGSQIAKYRKMHLFDIDIKGGQRFQESAVLTPGSEIAVFDTEFGKIGLAICFDIRFTELFRLIALKGARLVLVPAAFNMTTGPRHWELLYRSQAVNNQFFIAGTATARDTSASYVSWAHSLVTDPWGDVITQADEKETLLITELHLREADAVREQIPVLTGRRTDVYHLQEII